MMTHRQRMLAQIRGQSLDRIPKLGGWNLGVRNLAALAGISVEQYLKNPMQGVVAANRRLQVDAMVFPIVPTEIDSIRAGALEEAHFNVEPEVLRDRARAIPDSEATIRQQADPTDYIRRWKEYVIPMIQAAGDIPLIPTVWEGVTNFALYFQYGYEAFLAACALYPDEIERIWWEDSIKCQVRNQALLEVFSELDMLPLVFCGHDICLNQGPMCDPKYLHQRYWPHVPRALEPWTQAGIRVICHCDGNVMPIIDDALASGFTGFQGFQYECEVDPFLIRAKTLNYHPHPIFFSGLSVSRTLPDGHPADVIDEVEYMLDFTQGGQGMFLFTSNVTGVEVPPENLLAAYDHLHQVDVQHVRASAGKSRVWPWLLKQPRG